METYVPSLRLIDFGCAIDMNLFKKGTEFKKVSEFFLLNFNSISNFPQIIQTDGFTCTEMQEGRPWSYQTDLFCVAGTIHVMLFGEYMQVNKKFGNWEIKLKFPRFEFEKSSKIAIVFEKILPQIPQQNRLGRNLSETSQHQRQRSSTKSAENAQPHQQRNK